MVDRDINGKLKISYSAMVQIIVYVITLTLVYAALDKRVTRLEDDSSRVTRDLGEIKADIKILLRRQP